MKGIIYEFYSIVYKNSKLFLLLFYGLSPSFLENLMLVCVMLGLVRK